MNDNGPTAKSTNRELIELLLVSALSLYVELLVIRWLSADIRGFTIFRSFPLVACFVGFGVGYALRQDSLFRMVPFALLQTAVVIKLVEWSGLAFFGFPSASVYQFTEISIEQLGVWGNVLLFMVLLILTLSGPFATCVCMGSKIGVLFERMKPLTAYAFNLAGAFIGSIVFTALSFCRLSPAMLLVPVCLILALLVMRNASKIGMCTVALALVAAPICASFHAKIRDMPLQVSVTAPIKTTDSIVWSPYQRIDLRIFDPEQFDYKQFLGLELGVNRSFYLYFFNPDLKADKAPPVLSKLLAERNELYAFPYALTKAKDVLIIGAGAGQDAAAAVQTGASRVDAIEIDPCIVDIGKKYNRYYINGTVNVVCDDARHYLRTCDKKYDCISFTLLDSQTVAGLGSSVRLDTYIYTQESIQSALKLLKPGGLLTLSFAANKPYLADRLFYTMKAAAGYEPMVVAKRGLKFWAAPFFILGAAARDKSLRLPPEWQSVSQIPAAKESKLLTDDWPYLYVDTNVLDLPFLAVVVQTLLLALFVCRRFVLSPTEPIYWEMFFLGAGFLLMELASIAKLSLLFGSTWLTAAIVINGILILIFVANILVLKFQQFMLRFSPLLFLIIFLTLISAYLLPVKSILQSCGSGMLGNLVVSATMLLPLFIAGLIFPTAFAQAPSAPRALTFNVLGAVVGGFLEYLSNLTGINALSLIALLLYGCAFACSRAAHRKAPPRAG